MMRSADVKVAGYALCILMPMLAPLGIRLHLSWLAPGLVFGFFPVLSLVIVTHYLENITSKIFYNI